MQDFQITHRDALPHGILVGVTLPVEREATVPDAVLERLHDDERALALTYAGRRRVEFVGGRLAARAAIQALGRRPGPVLRDPYGCPTAPPGVALSISHKRHLAVALVARADFGVLGVDLEQHTRPRSGIAERVLTEAELAEIEALPEDRRWASTVVRFSIKESIYKALAPKLRRYIAFGEAEVSPYTDGTSSVRLMLTEDSPPASIEARFSWLDDAVLSSVRVQWA